MDTITPGSIIFSEIDKNAYLIELYENILYNYSIKIFELNDREEKPINIEDALKFADLLSNSNHPKKTDKHKIWAQEIVALLNSIYPDNKIIKYYLGSILSNTHNYPGISNQTPNYKSNDFLDFIYSEYAENMLLIPAEPDKKFLPSQKRIYDRFAAPYLSYSGPTSMGKSFIMRMFIKELIMNNSKKNFAMIVPTKALINEVTSKITSDLQGLLAEMNYKIVTSPGSLFLKKQYNFIYILTPERLLYLLITYPNTVIDYLFIDEAHKISSSDSRSTFYYKTVEMLYRTLNNPITIFASPNIPNPEIYLKLINIPDIKENSISSTFSPVSQIKYYIDYPLKNIYIYNNYTESLSFLKKINPNETKSINCVFNNLGKSQKNVIYCGSKAKALKLAKDFAEGKPDLLDDKDLMKLSSDVGSQIHGDCYLASLIRKGIAYHVGYLPAAIRMRIEDLYKNGSLNTLFCTSTLIEGVNLPADNLFITTYYNGPSIMSNVDFANLVGRVGRIEFNLYGNVFLTRIEDNSNNLKDRFEKFLSNKVPPQKLSIVSELTSTQKQHIIESLKNGKIGLLKYPKSQTEENYELMRKFAIILVRDIVRHTKHSIVKNEFSEYLRDGVEEQIRKAFLNRKDYIDDDINISADQTESLSKEIRQGLQYPNIDVDGFVSHEELMVFLKRLSKIFNWRKYEKSTLGNTCKNFEINEKCNLTPYCLYCKGEPYKRLSFYAVVLSKWIEGRGLNWIIKDAINYKQNNPINAIQLPDRSRVNYNHSTEHKNIIIADTLDIVEYIILFKFSNYFLKFSAEFKKINGPDSLVQDWYEYVEYGTTNELSIFFQRNGFSRETANFIKDKGYYIQDQDGDYKIKNAIKDSDNLSIVREINEIAFNAPELFIN